MFAFHIDMNYAAFKIETIREMLDLAAATGYDTVLWEIEDKVQLEALGPSVHPDAMTKAEFKELLVYAESLQLKSFPLLQTLGHAEYVLKDESHYAWREADFPDCYCTSNPDVRKFLIAMIEEMIELFGQPEYFHLGGDEAYHYQTCELCKSQDHDKMFIEHETYLANVLAKHGIRPCVWADMLRYHEGIMQGFDRRFVIWHWNYKFTTAWEDLDKLLAAGYDVVICPASSSGGDSAFLPRWRIHADNIIGAVNAALDNHLTGVCITSWSVRLGVKKTQLPLWKLGAMIYREKLTPEAAEAEVKKEFFGGADPEAMGRWDWFLTQLSGVLWRSYKDGVPAPAGLFTSRLKEFGEDYQKVAAELPRWIAEAEAAQKIFPVTDEISLLIRQGSDLRIRQMKILHNLLNDKAVPAADLEQDQRDFEAFLATDQTPGSARRNAELTYAPLKEYNQSLA